MTRWVKICGINSPAALAAAVEAGADALGFVFAESRRRVTPAQAAGLCASLPAGVRRVAVMRHPTAEQWHAVWEGFRPDALQTDADDFDTLVVDPACERLPVVRDTQCADPEGTDWPPTLLFEGGDSGTGRVADWALAARVARRTRLVLAGGLDPDNVAEAVRQVRPWGVDVSSGVESAPGVKDPARIRAFVVNARAAFGRLQAPRVGASAGSG